VATLRRVLCQADQADEVLGVAEVRVLAIVAVHGASVPWGRVDSDGVTVVPARRVPGLLWALPPILGPERVAWLADRARLRFRAADDRRHTWTAEIDTVVCWSMPTAAPGTG
jgi:hypothetical protein